MSTRAKTAKTLIWTALLAVTAATGAWADPNPGNDSGQFTVRITPNVDLGVTVDTTGASWNGSADLDVTMDLGTENVTPNPVLVTIAGNFNNQEMQLTGAALNTWTLDTDETPGLDQLRLYATFGADNFGEPDSADFDGTANLVTTAPKRAGQPQADENALNDLNHQFEMSEAATEFIDVDGLSVGDPRKLYLRANTPPTTTTSEQQAFTVTVTAVTGAGQ